jgi:hypothetical protein
MNEPHLLNKLDEFAASAARSLQFSRRSVLHRQLHLNNAALFNRAAGFYGQMLGIASMLPDPDRMQVRRAA